MVRHEAGEALGALGDVDSLDLLRHYLNDAAEEVRQTCEIAIARIEWASSDAAKTERLHTRYVGCVPYATQAQNADSFTHAAPSSRSTPLLPSQPQTP